MIYCSNPKEQYLSYKEEIDDAIRRVLSSGNYILNKEVEKFEEEFWEVCYCIGNLDYYYEN